MKNKAYYFIVRASLMQ